MYRNIEESIISERDVFEISGPTHLSSFDWCSPDHRRSIAASLVQGAYIMERDRQTNRLGEQALAQPWWSFFHFQLIRPLIDDADQSIFGAIYENKYPFQPNSASNGHVPRFVFAFRGTVTKGDAVSRDLELDFHFIRHRLHQSSRCEIATQAAKDMVNAAGNSKIWLAGHSLGASVATIVGKKIAENGILLESFLFNPPFISAPIERIKDKNIKHGIRFAASVITAGLAIASKGRQPASRSLNSFTSISSWIPHLFVNPEDHICSEYIGYFEHRQRMDEIGAGTVERLATQHSIGGLFLSAIGNECDPVAVHLLPSANLIINRSHTPDFKYAHGIHQWWRPGLDLNQKQYVFS